MISRATLVPLLCILAGITAAHSAAPTYNRSQNFQTLPDNWTYFNPNQFYGYQTTKHTGTKGEAGGLFQPKLYFNYYADTFLNGTLTRNTPITASGRLALDRISADPQYTNSSYICHFGRGSNGFISTVGIALTGYNSENVLCAAILSFADGTAFIGNSFGLPVVPGSPYLDWSYSWHPTGGSQGFGYLVVRVAGGRTSTINLTKTSAGLDFALDSFGLFQPPFPAPNSNSFLKFDVGHLVYTALQGGSPKLRISAPQSITTSFSPLKLIGTATTTRGNRVTSVRYRVITGSTIGKYKNAKGIAKWSASIRLPFGTSRVEVIAEGDNGLVATATRRVRRTP